MGRWRDQAAPRGPARAVLDLHQDDDDLPFSAGMLNQALLTEWGAVKTAVCFPRFLILPSMRIYLCLQCAAAQLRTAVEFEVNLAELLFGIVPASVFISCHEVYWRSECVTNYLWL